MRAFPLARAAAFGLALGCTPTAEQTGRPAERRDLPPDPHSYAQPDSARVTHVSLDLAPDFATKRIRGTARLAIERNPQVDSIILDVRDLTIKRVTTPRGDTLGFTTRAAQQYLGSPLAIALPVETTSAQQQARSDTVVIEYETSPDAAAVQWLTPEQTAGKRLPFLFTQGQAILTRT